MKKRVFLLFFVTLFLFSCSQTPTEPERPVTSISFFVYEDEFVSLIIYDQFDMLVKTLVNEQLSPNNYIISWDGRNENGQNVASGLYYYTLKIGGYEITKRMILMK
jgi:flagellar hook assembly protein FlgD